MRQMRIWKHTVVCLTVVTVVLVGSTGAQAQTPPAAGTAKVDRLVLGLIEKFRDYMGLQEQSLDFLRLAAYHSTCSRR